MVVIGGGAAGFFGSLRAKAVNPSLKVTLLESAILPLSKVKISGGGRCNVTTAVYDVPRLVENYPRGRRELYSVFARFGPRETVHWFESRGVALKAAADGRVFPITDNSQTITDSLTQAAEAAKIFVITKCPVLAIRRLGDVYAIHTDHHVYEADVALLATGSARQGLQWAAQLGHTVVPPIPSLFTFKISDALLHGLAGLSFPRVVGCLQVAGQNPIRQAGPLLITHWGLSGPLTLRLSAWGARLLHAAQYQSKLILDFFPDHNAEELRSALLRLKAACSRKQIGNAGPAELPARFWERLLTVHEIEPKWTWSVVSQKSLRRLCQTLKHCVLEISGRGTFKEEFVTAGGVSLKEIDLKTMESRRSAGLYLAGEIIDADGLTGGFNLQQAWSTGWIAGNAIGQRTITASPMVKI